MKKGFRQASQLKGVLEVRRAGRASHVMYRARNKMKIWAVPLKSGRKVSFEVPKQ